MPDHEFFVGNIPEQGGAALLTVAGGTVDEMGQAAEAQGFETVWFTVDGEWIAYSTTAPDFVNDRLREAFPDGIPEGTSVLVSVPQGGGTTGTPGGDMMTMTAELSALNTSVANVGTATGTATFTIDGDHLTVEVEASGLAPNMAHAQHIHAGDVCPGPDADTNNDGFVDVIEGVPFYGAILLPLDDNLADTAANTFPMADAQGNISYSATASISEIETALGEDLALSARHVVQHGVGPNVTVPSTVQSLGDLPAAATVPVNCGQITSGDAGASSTFSVDIQPLNDSNAEIETASGSATFTVNGDQLTVKVEASGLEPGIGHAHHIHAGTACPTMAADTNGDGFLDVIEGVPTYGAILVPLDDNIADTTANNFPTADAQGNLSYTGTASISEIETALGEELNVGARHYVIHGVDSTIMLPSTVQSLGDLPAHATLPVGCGQITESAS